MSSAARAATRSSQQGGPAGSLILGVILIFVGTGIETERFRATAIITGVILVLTGIYALISQEQQETPETRRQQRAEDEFIRKIRKSQRAKKDTQLKEEEGVPCPSCQTINYPNTRFCLSCGKEM